MHLFLSRFLEAEGAEGEGWGTWGVSGAVLWAYGTPRGLSGSLESSLLALFGPLSSFVLSACAPRPCTFTLKLFLLCACDRLPASTPPKGPKIGFSISCPNPFPRPTPQSKVMAETVSEPAPTMVPIFLRSLRSNKPPQGFVSPGSFSVCPDRKALLEVGTHICVFRRLGWGTAVG